MQEQLQEAEKLLTNLLAIHQNHALQYSHKSLCQYRFNGQEKQSQKAKEEALSHDGVAQGLQTGLTQIKNILNSYTEQKL